MGGGQKWKDRSKKSELFTVGVCANALRFKMKRVYITYVFRSLWDFILTF